MAFRLYLVPVVGSGTKADRRRPKYFADGTLSPSPWTAMDYGFEPWMVVGANLSAADDATVVAAPDGLALPVNLDAVLTAANVTTVQTKLEAINVPAGWVTTALTWRQVVRIVLGMFLVLQRFAVIHGITRLFAGAITLDSTIADLPSGARTDLSAAATSLGLSVSGITGTTTIRQALKTWADQLQGRPLTLFGTAI